MEWIVFVNVAASTAFLGLGIILGLIIAHNAPHNRRTDDELTSKSD